MISAASVIENIASCTRGFGCSGKARGHTGGRLDMVDDMGRDDKKTKLAGREGGEEE